MADCVTVEVTQGEMSRTHHYWRSPNGVLFHLDNSNVQISAAEASDKALIAAHAATYSGFGSNLDRYTIKNSNLFVNEYVPYVARPIGMQESSRDIRYIVDDDHLSEAKLIWRELNFIWKQFEDCFDTCSIDERNFEVFGTKFESLIFLCCAGIEALFEKIIRKNGCQKSVLNMNSYIKLKKFLRINEYSISLVYYHKNMKFKPFAEWDLSNPKNSLKWYSDFISLKHEKTSARHKANMINALNCAAAYYVVAYATFGQSLFPGYISDVFFFQIDEYPKWSIDEHYFQIRKEILELPWKPVPIF